MLWKRERNKVQEIPVEIPLPASASSQSPIVPGQFSGPI
jgi:hypothetical protein